MAGENKQTAAASGKVSKEDLLKSIQDLEVKQEAPAAAAAEPTVETEALEKSTAEAVKDGASAELKKALDVSDALTEIVGLIGTHVDKTMEAMVKSINDSAERDLAFVRVVGDLKKSVEGLSGQITEFGNQPAAAPMTKNAATNAPAMEALSKSATPTEQVAVEAGKQDITALRKTAASTLENLVHNTTDQTERDKLIKSAIMLETTGKLDQFGLSRVNHALSARQA